MIYQALIHDKTPFLPSKFDNDDYQVVDARNELANGILILWGGADISPSLYKEKPNSYTNAYEALSPRDRAEKLVVEEAVKNKVPIIGICRGAQLLCALAGGKLIQHVSGHGVTHSVETNEGEFFTVTSSHHQMMRPGKSQHIVLAWSPKCSTCYLGEDDEPLDIEQEPEIVYFPKLNALAVQPHPEWESENSSLNKYLRKTISELLLKELGQ